ncbi:MAG: hypothetical protein PF481_00420 [Bacteroidales bacterium]|jgi:A/G-specific adenine glycosylase|nr:hypothetical protein [Bacteroidales bacterium]
MKLSQDIITDFQHTVLQKGQELFRHMPWRDDTNPYYILLSELMLQQTQVFRVVPKFQEFITAFPTISDLAQASFEEILSLWSGLGYNRRARFLHNSARLVDSEYNGIIPKTYEQLITLPGIGPNTAGAILVYAHNQAVPFIETNIRTVFIYTFFPDTQDKIKEHSLSELVEQTLYTDNPRVWYWSLMDYGVYIKKTIKNYNAFSDKHTIQSKFEGSFRQKRAQIVRMLLQESGLKEDAIAKKMNQSGRLCSEIIASLVKDGLVQKEGEGYRITN